MMLIFLAPFLLLLDTASAVVRQGQSIGPGAEPSHWTCSHDKMGPTSSFTLELGGDTGRCLLSTAPLPYPKDALEPYLSRETVEWHYRLHGRTCAAHLTAGRLRATEASTATALWS